MMQKAMRLSQAWCLVPKRLRLFSETMCEAPHERVLLWMMQTARRLSHAWPAHKLYLCVEEQ